MPSFSILAAVVLLGTAAVSFAATVAVRTEGPVDGPAVYGLDRLKAALAASGHTVADAGADATHVVVAGLAGQGAESLTIRRAALEGKPSLRLTGADPRGLMYALLEAAGSIAPGPDPFAAVREAAESPYLAERGISMYTMQRAYFESRLYEEGYWKAYFDLLARSRINTFTVIFGYENGGFLAPLYPYFFDVPGYANVKLTGITPQQQARNTAAFRALIRIAHERGVDVIPAVWDHIYRGGVQGGGIAGADQTVGKAVPHLVTGVTPENLTAYTQAALRRFLATFPDIDGIEFRMHAESGLKPEEMAGFWHQVFAGLAQAKPGLRVTLRAKELPDAIIQDALDQGLRARIETKYWMEQMGLPFHPTHVNPQNQHDRRHGYADLLRYPQTYRVHWRLWSGGTTRLLLWADPEYVRRFAASARLYDGNSFDVNEMLATRMLGEPHDAPVRPILNEKYRHFTYEFERYWHFYQLWGRLTYNPQTPPALWEAEFARRFGKAGPPLMEGLHTASQVLPRIVAASYRYALFPTTRGWAEMMRQGDLPTYAGLEGSDTAQFESPKEAARRKGGTTGKRTPQQTSDWFRRKADRIFAHASAAEAAGAAGKEAVATITDLRILAWLARYHAARLLAAVDYNWFRGNGERARLSRAIEHEKNAIEAWREIVNTAGDVYRTDLAFGVERVGFPRHWKDELAGLEAGLPKLEAELAAAPEGPVTRPDWGHIDRFPPNDEMAPTVWFENPPATARPGQDWKIVIGAKDRGTVRHVRLRYRHLTQFEDYETAHADRNPRTGLWEAVIPGSYIRPEWDLVYYVEATDEHANESITPDLDLETPYRIVTLERPRAVLR